jgi:rifampicin phosphotransferase
MSTSTLIPLHEIQPSHAAHIGGKAMGLGNLLQHGFPVPKGFVLTVDAYRRSVDASLSAHINTLLAGLDERTDNRAASSKIHDLFLAKGLDHETDAAIRSAYAALGAGLDTELPVAVRSSATAEDAVDASFAGQQETYLWIRGADEVCKHVVRCWASLFTPQAIGYRARFSIAPDNLAMAVVVQQMVDAAAAGVMFTLDPANGDRGTIYIESAHGLGEVVVRGEVSPDRFHVDKKTLGVRAQIAIKQCAYRFDAHAGEVKRVALDADEAHRPSLSNAEAAALAELGTRVEQAFGRPMDIEWAIDNERRIHLLQARPETVWSRRPTREQVAAVIGRHDDWDPLNDGSPPHQHWTTVNFGEALPGTLTPLGWTTWDGLGDRMITEAFYAMGALASRERAMPPRELRKVRVFYGRAACDPLLFIGPGDRLPGTSGKQIAEHIFGEAPEGLTYAPTKRRWPIIAFKMPYTMLTIPDRLRRDSAATDAWWKQQIPRVPTLDKAAAITLYAEARQRFYANIINQAIALMTAVQPMYQMLEGLAAKTGIGSAGALAGGYGDVPEVAVVHDMWRASRGECTLDDVVNLHGYHGPMEGEISGKVWREDPTPLRNMLAGYASRGEAASPLARDLQRRNERLALEAAIIAAVPRWQRPLVRAQFKFAASRIPLRGVAKNAFLQALDVARAAARRVGEHLAAEGILESADDVFMLTVQELEAGPQAGVASLVTKRRARHAAYRELNIPTYWKGEPTPRFASDPPEFINDGALTGIGVSAGIVEGRARVVMEPDFAEVEPDEILVAPTTDPSWSSIMFISAGLVVDIGGAMSHAAVVARELGIPCVVNCLVGTQVIRSGDLVRIDGGAGTVEILERADAIAAE